VLKLEQENGPVVLIHVVAVFASIYDAKKRSPEYILNLGTKRSKERDSYHFGFKLA